jgi:hypothetical protein
MGMTQHYGRENSVSVGEIAQTFQSKLTAMKRYTPLYQSFVSRLPCHQDSILAAISFSKPWSLGE